MFHFHEASTSNRTTQTILYECNQCESSFPSRTFLHHHELQHNCIFKCPHCPALFSNKPDFTTHAAAHTEMRLIRCAICRKTFFDEDEYKVHVKTHTEPGMHKCDKCSAWFCQKAFLRAHMATHPNKIIKFVHSVPRLAIDDVPETSTTRNEIPPISRQKRLTRHPSRSPKNKKVERNTEIARELQNGKKTTSTTEERIPSNSAPENIVTNQCRCSRKRRPTAKKSADTDSQTSSIDQMPSTSEPKKVTRQQNRQPKTRKAEDETISSVIEEILTTLKRKGDDVNSARKKQRLSRLEDKNVAPKARIVNRPPKSKNAAGSITENERSGCLPPKNNRIDTIRETEESISSAIEEILTSLDERGDDVEVNSTKKTGRSQSPKEFFKSCKMQTISQKSSMQHLRNVRKVALPPLSIDTFTPKFTTD